ncbi:MAG: alpha/beta fold hydrolase [Propionibacteriaceae bacterium]|nr:alpha/beta fold hydrolase [Propionibacteriaceae bacterium]
MEVQSFAEPFYSDSGSIGVLFCHGFTGSPWSLLEWAQVTAAAGYRVSLPRLPGHGTNWQELNTTSWQDWYACVEREFLELKQNCDQVFVAGLSLGGALALRLAEQYYADISGLILVNPAISAKTTAFFAPLLAPFIPTVKAIGSDIAKPGIDEKSYPRTPLKAVASMQKFWFYLRPCLDLVVSPVLMFRSAIDHVVPAASARTILTHISSSEITEVVLKRSYHVATMDYDKELIFENTLEFLASHTESGSSGASREEPQANPS